MLGALAAAAHRVVAYDRRGFGRSGNPGRGYDYDTLADELEAALARSIRTTSPSSASPWAAGYGPVLPYFAPRVTFGSTGPCYDITHAVLGAVGRIVVSDGEDGRTRLDTEVAGAPSDPAFDRRHELVALVFKEVERVIGVGL